MSITLLMMVSVFASLVPTASAAEWIKVDIGNVGATIYSVYAGDGDNNDVNEVYAASRNGGVFKIQQEKDNPKNWDTDTVGFGEGQNFNMRAVVIGDGRANGKNAVYAGGQDIGSGWPYHGKMYEFRFKDDNWEKTHMWTGGWGVYDLDFGDGDNDNEGELYAASYDGRIYEFTYTNSWNANDLGFTQYYAMGVAVGDGDNDGKNEVFAISGYSENWYPKRAYRYKYNAGSWTVTNLGRPPNSPDWSLFRDVTVGDGDNDGKNEVYVSDYGYVYQLDFSAVDTWSWSTIYSNQNQYIHHLSVGDGDADGKNEVYAAAAVTNAIYELTYNQGSWSSEAVGSATDEMWSVHVADGDTFPNQMEVYGGSADSHVYQFMMDVTPPPNPVVWSPTHTVGIWSNLNNIEVRWRHPPDPSGIKGYSFAWSTDPNTIPDDTIDLDGEEEPRTKSGVLADGNNYYFHIRAQDNARNWNPGATHFGPLKIDTDRPVALGVDIDNGAQYTNNKLVTLYLSGNDTKSGMGYMAFSNNGATWPDEANWEPWNTTRTNWDLTDINFGGNDNDGLKQVSMRATDLAKNEGANMVNDTIFLDRKPPVSLTIKINNNDQYTSNPVVTLNLTASDPDQASGLSKVQFSNDGTNWSDWQDWTTSRSDWSLISDAGGTDIDGKKWVYFKVKDKAGNIAGPIGDDIFLDRSPPTDLSIIINSGDQYTNVTNVALNLSANDPVPGAGIYQMSFSNDNAQWSSWEEFGDYKNPWSLTVGAGGADTDGDKPVYYRVRDQVSNIGGPVKDTIFLDRAKPNQLRISINNGATLTNKKEVTLTLSAVDPAPASGVNMMQFREEGGGWTSWEPWAASKAFDLSAGDGTKTVYFRVKDRAGNVANPVSDSIVLDTTAPLISNIKAIGITDTSAIITWTTDSPADGTVDYGTTTSYGSQKFDDVFVTEHSITLSGLTPDTEYHYRVASSDEVGNGPTVSSDHNFKTLKTPDKTPPVISNVRVEGITDRFAMVLWDTNEPADGFIYYGETTAYGMMAGSGTHVSKHSISLTGLTPSTTYYFKVESKDSSGNGPVNATGQFTTAGTPDVTAPVITNVKVTDISDTKAVVQWTTDEIADSTVEFGVSSSYGNVATDPTYMKEHLVKLTGLSPGTTYYFIVRSTDPSGNGPSTSAQYTFQTRTTADTTPPIISSVMVSGITNTMAIITWTTDELGDSTIEYGTSTSYGSLAEDIDFVLSHTISLTGLTPSTKYHFRVKSSDLSGNGPSVSEDYTFTTKAVEDKEAPIIEWVKVEGVRNDVAVVLWKTNEPANSKVEFGLDIGYGSTIKDDAFVIEHSVLLKDLNASTVYHFKVGSTDLSGNGPTYSIDYQFSTEDLIDGTVPVLTNISVVNITENSARIRWVTDEPSNSLIAYGKNATIGQPFGDVDHYRLSHELDLQDLDPGTSYSFKVFSYDPSGNLGESGVLNFTTKKKTSPPTPPPPGPNPLGDNFNWLWLILLIAIIAALTVGTAFYLHSRNKRLPARRAAGARGGAAAATKGRARARPRTRIDEEEAMEVEELDMEDEDIPMVAMSGEEGDPGTLDMGEEEEADWDLGGDDGTETLDMGPPEDLGTLDMGDEGDGLELGGAIAAVTGTSVAARPGMTAGKKEEKRPLKKVRCPGCKAAIPIYSETQTDIECPECGKKGKVKPMKAAPSRKEDPGADRGARADPISPLDDVLGPGSSSAVMTGGGPRTTRPARPTRPPAPPKTMARAGPGKGPKTPPLKTLICSGCRGKVPIYTDKRPVKISCPNCGKGGTIRK